MNPPDEPTVDVCIFAPTPLLTVTIENEADNHPRMHLHVGGQGAWIARMVRTLRARPRFCGPFGGETGRVAQVLCDDEHFEVHAVEASGWNGSYVHDRRSGDRVELAATPAAALTRHELDDLYSTCLGVALKSGACIIPGPHFPGVVPDDSFGRLAADVRAAGVPVLTDLSGTALTAALETAQPTLVKLSDDELESGGWATGSRAEDVLDGIGRLQEAGAHDVVVSRGSEPTIAVLADKRYLVHSPEVTVVDSRGGGDAMAGALGVGLARRLGPIESLRLAAAAAMATMSRHGLGSGRRELIEAAVPRIEIEPLP